MLPYWSDGLRRYDIRPILPSVRNNWEFQAVLDGEITPSGPGYADSPPKSRTLWLFSPLSLHGWKSSSGQSAEIAVFHFTQIPEPAFRLIEGKDSLCVDLKDDDIRTIKDCVKAVKRAYKDRNALSSLVFRSVMDRLSLIVCRPWADQFAFSGRERDEAVVSQVESLFRAEPEWGIDDIASRIGLSAAHLRRLFRRYRYVSPRESRERIIMERARGILVHSHFDILEVALACGFTGHSAFSRAYRRYWGETPGETRRSGDARMVRNLNAQNARNPDKG